MRKFVNYLVLVPLAIVLVMFAVANREVQLSIRADLEATGDVIVARRKSSDQVDRSR